jgi:hypothetical protein
MALIEIDGLRFLKPGGFSMAMLNNQMVNIFGNPPSMEDISGIFFTGMFHFHV